MGTRNVKHRAKQDEGKTAQLVVDIWSDNELPADYSDLAELFESHLEHVASLCREGYQSGEIVDENFSGWWSVSRK